MEVSPNALRKETVATLKEVNSVLELVGQNLEKRIPLLLAKAQCLNTLTLLNEQEKRRRA